MLTQLQLTDQLKATIGKPKVIELTKVLIEEQFALRDLIDLTFDEDKHIAFRASWLLESVFLKVPLCYILELEYLISRFKDVNHPGCQRHYAKIIMHITNPRAPIAIYGLLQQIDMQDTVEHLFEWIIDAKVKIAVKIFASEALFNLQGRYAWIAEELPGQLQYLMRGGTAAIQTKGKKLLKQLN